jgi:hypothetical protein
MGKRQKRRKRKRSEDRAEQARLGLPVEGDDDEEYDEEEYEDDDEDEDDEEEDESSLGSRFGIGRFRQTNPQSTPTPTSQPKPTPFQSKPAPFQPAAQPKPAPFQPVQQSKPVPTQPQQPPQYDDKPWWAKEEDTELDDYEREQYGEYQAMPPPMQPEHLRQPEVKKDGQPIAATPTPASSPLKQVTAATTQAVGKVGERVKKIDWELVRIQAEEALDKTRKGLGRVKEEAEFRNLQMREKVPPKYHIAVYVGLVAVPVILILVLGFLLFGRGGTEPEVVVQITAAPTEQPLPTAAPEVVLPTSAPIVLPTDAPVELPTDAPIIEPTSEPIIQPTTAPVGSVAVFFAPPIQQWSADIQRWAQTYGVDADFMAVVMQLETCGNPNHLGSEGRMGLFAVPGDRFQPNESFINPEDNARRAAELIIQCYAMTNNDPGQAYACYRSNTDTTQADFGQWGEAMQRSFLWGIGLYGDTQSGAQVSPALNDWLVNGGGFDVCNQAQAALDSQ